MCDEINTNKLLWALSGSIDLVGITDLYHGKRVAYISERISRELAHFPWKSTDIIAAGLLHDCGVSSTDEHEQLIRAIDGDHAQSHCIRGANLLKRVSCLSHLAESVELHHTHWNTHLQSHSGMLGNLLFLADRIDVIAATASNDILIERNMVWETINNYSGTLFNPEFVAAFGKLYNKDIFWLEWQQCHLAISLQQWANDRSKHLGCHELRDLARMFSFCVDGKSPFTHNHSVQVSIIASDIAAKMGISHENCKKIEIAGLLHDIGKLRVPDGILEKKGPLDYNELQIMRHHSYDTYMILNTISGLEEITQWAMHHHEKLNGSGYPQGLTGDQLPIESRIIAVADIFQALAQDRPYRDGMSYSEIIAILANMVKQGEIDAQVVGVITDHENEYREVIKRQKCIS